MSSPVFSYFLKIIILFGAYFVTAWAGLQFDAVSGFATFVWPPAGIAMAAVFIYGRELWPGIFVAAFLVNWLNGAPLPVALGIGIGNTVEALVASYILKNSVNFRVMLDNIRDVVRFIVLGAFLSSMIAATVGVSSLLLGRVIEFSSYGETWMAWWIGDMLGIHIVGSLLLIWLGGGKKIIRSINKAEYGLLLLLTAVTGFVVFSYADGGLYPITYMVFIPVMWAAIRFGQYGTVITAAILSSIAIWGTVIGFGPFLAGTLAESLLYLQIFMGTLSGTGMLMAAAVMERREKERMLTELNEELEVRVLRRTEQLSSSEKKLEEYSRDLEKKVAVRTRDLEGKLEELERLNRFMVGRELKMIELKEEIKNQQMKLEELRRKIPLKKPRKK